MEAEATWGRCHRLALSQDLLFFHRLTKSKGGWDLEREIEGGWKYSRVHRGSLCSGEAWAHLLDLLPAQRVVLTIDAVLPQKMHHELQQQHRR